MPLRETHAYSVQSSSRPDKWYDVLLNSERHWKCSCPDHIYRRRVCKHIEQALTAYLHGL
jgi:hypothetical protein